VKCKTGHGKSKKKGEFGSPWSESLRFKCGTPIALYIVFDIIFFFIAPCFILQLDLSQPTFWQNFYRFVDNHYPKAPSMNPSMTTNLNHICLNH
jgi:hypothetical protein